MLDKSQVREIAQSLVDDWNKHDLVSILKHYHEDVQATNPIFCLLLGKEDGVLCGKATLTPYWAKALEQMPHLHIKIHNVYLGVDSFVIHYQGIFERDVVEVFKLDSAGKIVATTSFLESLDMP
ncbi:MAG: nuclear transport factor 2 family protein [Desulfovibrio sp.]|nr:nuclear transport factor 2 family protein [Desulfovibrio sp.]MBI4959211.1 nuclear transport factor 2 family protein [Desulfovibrio sp.]